MRTVKTRFAPSPTGYLHIGGARTALFSWAYARQQGGQFFLRVEDTDSARSNAVHSEAIIAAMQWLELVPDGAPIFQSANRRQHMQKVEQLLDEGNAYRCYTTPEELDALREAQLARGENPRYDRRWRDSSAKPPAGISPAVRFKMPLAGETTFSDAVKGELAIASDMLDDFIIARADGSPTYNLAAVADDIEMGITHIIRGDDHVMNTYRQWHLFAALAPQMPVFAHLPMILAAATSEDGKVQTDESGGTRYVRMSKRHAAVDIALYRREGFLPQAMCNYLARLSWARGDAEMFDRDFFVEHFSFAGISQSPARFDLERLKWLNREHMRALPPADLRRRAGIEAAVPDEALALVSQRGDTLAEIKSEAAYFEQRPPLPDGAALPREHRAAFAALLEALKALAQWDAAAIKECIKQSAAAHQLSFKHLGMPARQALTGRRDSPDIATVAALLGRKEAVARLSALLAEDAR